MDNKLIILFSIFFLSFGLFVSLIVFEKPLTRLTRAKEELKPSVKKSLIIAWPLTLKANGKSLSLITVFVRNNKGQPIGNKKISLTTNLGKIAALQSTTNKIGKATFTIKSSRPGIAKINAFIKMNNQLKLQQTMKIEFK